MQSDELFWKKVRKCKRCGRLLTSDEAVATGYGRRCMELEGLIRSMQEPIEGQISLMEYLNSKEDKDVGDQQQ